MNGNDLLKGLGHVDDSLIYEAGQNKVNRRILRLVAPIAASFAIMFTAVLFWSNYQSNLPIAPDNDFPPVISDDSSHKNKKYTLHFNQADSQMAARIFIEGHFWKELTSEQKKRLLPEIAKKYQIDATVHYSYADGVASLFSVTIGVKTNNKDVNITLSPNAVAKCYVIAKEPVLSEIEGVKIEAGIVITDKSSSEEQNYNYYADFKLDEVAYCVEYSGEEKDKELFTTIIADIILSGKADLSMLANPAVPELRDDRLTESEAYNESDFGSYLPKVPPGYQFNEAVRFINQDSDFLRASWSQGYNDISVSIAKLKEQDRERMVSPEDTPLYYISLYSTPWADSMPRDKSHIIQNPIFTGEALTVDLLRMREFVPGERGMPSESSTHMRFSVLYDDILVEITTEGVSSEYLFHELSNIPRT